MNTVGVSYDDEGEAVFLDEDDVIDEIPIDEEELPDVDDIEGSDAGSSGSEAEFDLGAPDDSICAFKGHTARLYSVACSPTDPNIVATGGEDDRGFLWNIGQGDWSFELKGHTDTISNLGFSSDGQLLASGCFDGLVKVWDISSQYLKCKTLDCMGQKIEWVKWHPREHLVLALAEDSAVFMWNADSGVLLKMFSGHNNIVTCGDFTPDGRMICIGYEDATLKIWNPENGRIIHVVGGRSYHMKGLTCLSLSSDSTLALTGSSDGSVRLVNIITGKVVGSLTYHSGSIECVGFASSSFPFAATGSMDGNLVIWDLQHMTPRRTCKHNEEGIICMSWLGSSRYLATGGVDGKVRIWDSLPGDCMRTFNGHLKAIHSLAVSANGDFLVSASKDRTARVFDISGLKNIP